MRQTAGVVGSLLAIAVCLAPLAAAQDRSPVPGSPFSPVIERAAVLNVMTAAADWQLGHPSMHATYEWTQAAFYTGMMALAGVSDSPKYFDAMKAMGEKNQWRPGLRPGHADDYAVIATYAKIFEREKDNTILAPALALFNFLAS
jgi:rhamnogalacturonyl hydrolase YesR